MKFGAVCILVFCFADGVEFEKTYELTTGSKCKTKTGAQGVCRPILECPNQLHVVGQFPSQFWPLICEFHGIHPVICCPDPSLRPSEQACRNVEEDLRSGNLNLIDIRTQTSKTQGIAPVSKATRPANITTNTAKPAKGLSQDNLQTNTSMQTPQPDRLTYKTSANLLSGNVTTKDDSSGVHFVHGGFEVPNGTHRHMVALGYLNNGTYDWLCGGTLISEYYVMTAAHCVASVHSGSPDVVWVGVHDLRSKSEGAVVPVENYTLHPLYTPTSRYHDIALLKLKHVTLGISALPACLSSHLEDSASFTILGWGSTEVDGGPQSPTLQTALLVPVPQKRCNQSYTSKMYIPANLRQGIMRTMICAEGSDGLADACQGDSGGPLQIPREVGSPLFTVVGVTSFGKLCSGIGVYTRVASYLDWIESIVWSAEK